MGTLSPSPFTPMVTRFPLACSVDSVLAGNLADRLLILNGLTSHLWFESTITLFSMDMVEKLTSCSWRFRVLFSLR